MNHEPEFYKAAEEHYRFVRVPALQHALNISLGFNLGFIAVILGLLFSVTHYCM